MGKHTPGPWFYQERSDAYTHIVRGDGNRFITQLAQDTSGEAEANARLIAAAPELLDVVKRIAASRITDTGTAPIPDLTAEEAWTLARDAYAKATGESHG